MFPDTLSSREMLSTLLFLLPRNLIRSGFDRAQETSSSNHANTLTGRDARRPWQWREVRDETSYERLFRIHSLSENGPGPVYTSAARHARYNRSHSYPGGPNCAPAAVTLIR